MRRAGDLSRYCDHVNLLKVVYGSIVVATFVAFAFRANKQAHMAVCARKLKIEGRVPRCFGVQYLENSVLPFFEGFVSP